jgi:hypothetical protein
MHYLTVMSLVQRRKIVLIIYYPQFIIYAERSLPAFPTPDRNVSHFLGTEDGNAPLVCMAVVSSASYFGIPRCRSDATELPSHSIDTLDERPPTSIFPGR